MAIKYHVSKTTGKSEACHATVQACPVEPAFDETPGEIPHFDTKEEADAYIQLKGKEQYGEVSTVSKPANTVDATLEKINAGSVSDDEARALYSDVFKDYISEVESIERLRKEPNVDISELKTKMEDINVFRDKIESQGQDMLNRNFVIGTKKYRNTFIQELDQVAAKRATASADKVHLWDEKIDTYLQQTMRPRF